MAAPMSDISGYRSDGGGLGQDQGISKQLRGILTAKLPLLSAPGTVLENSLYYDINSSSVTAVEEQATFNKDRISFNNLQMGSTPSAFIPSVLFANTIFWIPVLPDVTVPVGFNRDSVESRVNIPLGWGFHAIEDIIVYMGASSIAQIQISGRTNFHCALATCETYEKRQLMLEGAGKYLNWRDVTSTLAWPNAGKSLWEQRNYGNFYNPANPGDTNDSQAPWLQQAVVPLRVPWSSMCILDKRLSLDTKLSTQPIQIALHTRQRDDFLELGTQFTPTVFPPTFGSSTLQMWQEELSDKSLSVRNELLAMPEFNVGYPFQYAQSIPFSVSTSNQQDTGDLRTTFTMNITSIINSDLTTFLFDVTWSARTSVSQKSGQYCPTYGEQLINIELLLNGQRFFAFDQDDYPFVTLAKQLDSPMYKTKMPAYNTTQTTDLSAASFNPQGYVYEFNNSRLRSIIAESHLQNTARFTNQTFQLRFEINRSTWYLLPSTTDGNNARKYSAGTSLITGYQLNMSYLYNAVYLVGGDGGTTKLITN